VCCVLSISINESSLAPGLLTNSPIGGGRVSALGAVLADLYLEVEDESSGARGSGLNIRSLLGVHLILRECRVSTKTGGVDEGRTTSARTFLNMVVQACTLAMARVILAALIQHAYGKMEQHLAARANAHPELEKEDIEKEDIEKEDIEKEDIEKEDIEKEDIEKEDIEKEART
jgi:hypothetical protein